MSMIQVNLVGDTASVHVDYCLHGQRCVYMAILIPPTLAWAQRGAVLNETINLILSSSFSELSGNIVKESPSGYDGR